MSIGIDFILKASTSAFNAGLASANNSLKELKHELHSFGVPRGLSHAVGLIGIIEGFKIAIEHAKETRKELEKLGKPVDSATASVARFGDVLSTSIKWAEGLAVKTLGIFTGLGDNVRRAISGVTEAEEQAARKMEVDTERAAAATEKRKEQAIEQDNERRVEGEKKLAEARVENTLQAATNEEKLTNNIARQNELLATIAATGRDSVKNIEARIELVKLETEEKKINAEIDKKAAEERKKEGEEELRIYKENTRREKELHDLKLAALKPEEQLAQLQKEKEQTSIRIIKKNNEGADTLKDQIDLQKNLNEQQKIKDALVKQEVETQKEIVKELEAQKNSAISIQGIRGGRQFNEAGEGELKEVVRRNRFKAQQIRGGSGGFGIGQDLEAARLEAEAINAQKEIDFRKNFLRQINSSGVERTRQGFSGDPLKFDRLLTQLTSGQKTSDKILEEAEKTNEILRGTFRAHK